MAVVTNLEADHLDIYADLDDLRRTFAQYVRGARYVVLCADDAEANALATPPTAEVIRYGLTSPDARLRATDLRREGLGTRFTSCTTASRSARSTLAVPGEHNVRNALAALAVGLGLGATVPQMAPGLAAFRGVERRFQLLGEAGGRDRRGRLRASSHRGARHHPGGARGGAGAPAGVAFQPHLFSRTRDFAREFGEALAKADVVYLLDIYPAREQPIDGVYERPDRRRHAGAGARAGVARARAPRSRRRSPGASRPGDLVMTMGAGDVTRCGARAAAPRSGARVSGVPTAAAAAASAAPAAVDARARRAVVARRAARRRPSGGRACCAQLAFFRVRKVEVLGARYTPPDEILDAAARRHHAQRVGARSIRSSARVAVASAGGARRS